MSLLDQAEVANSVSQPLLCFQHLFHTGTKTVESFFTTPDCVGTAIAGWKLLLEGLFQILFLVLNRETTLDLSKPPP